MASTTLSSNRAEASVGNAQDALAVLGRIFIAYLFIPSGLGKLMTRLGMDGAESPGQAAAAAEFALEGLYLNRKISKDTDDTGRVIYGA